MQQDWSKETLQNPNGSPLRARAARALGFMDTNAYLMQKMLLPDVEFDELLDEFLVQQLGPEWPKKFERFRNERQNTPRP